jgi:hypothetical protein
MKVAAGEQCTVGKEVRKMTKENKDPSELPEFHARILAAIPTGQDSAITISYLIDKMGLTVDSRRSVNQVLSDLIFKYEYPIGTSSDTSTRGVFLIEDEADLRLAARTLNSRAMKVLSRHKKIIENFNKKDQEKMPI